MTDENYQRSIAPVVHKYKLSEQPSDAAYWRTRPPEERMAALEQIRREYHLWLYGGEPPFQRVITIRRRTPPSTPPATNPELDQPAMSSIERN